MKYIVYRTENKINGKFYWGVHNGTKPEYLGSGSVLKRAINKYGRNSFIRRTIMEFDTEVEAYDFEKLIVDKHLVANKNCYNVSLGGIGGNKESPGRRPRCIFILGQAYTGLREASRQLDVNVSTIHLRLNNTKKTQYRYE